MEAIIVVLLLGIGVLVVGAALYLASALRRPADNSDALRLEQQIAVLQNELSRSVGAQQGIIERVGSIDGTLNQRLDSVTNIVDRRLQDMSSTVGQRLDAVRSTMGQSMSTTEDTIKNVSERLGELSQSTQQMLEVGRNISSLQDILKPPKLRGGFGELLLERLLGEILSDKNYTIQHRFRSGVQVDAAIHVGDSIVPVDSKFPLEAFHRLAKAETSEQPALRKEFVRVVRGHIDAVAKYILPDEGSLPFALMYIPAENVYYEIIVKDDFSDTQANLCAYAMERHVIPVSPSSFYAYLQAILIGLNGMRVEAHAQEIIRHVGRLSGDFSRIRKEFSTLGAHIKNASDRYSDIDRSVNKFGDRLQLTINEPLQAPLPQSDIAPAPLVPSLTNGNGHEQD